MSFCGAVVLKVMDQKTLVKLITRRTMDDYRNSPTIKFCANIFPAHRCPSALTFKIRLEYASVN